MTRDSGEQAERLRVAAEQILDAGDAHTARVEAAALREIAAEIGQVADFHKQAAARLKLQRAGREVRTALARAEQKIDRAYERL